MIRKAVLGTVLAAVCGAAFAALPNVAVYATGGTIAGQSAASDKTNYSVSPAFCKFSPFPSPPDSDRLEIITAIRIMIQPTTMRGVITSCRMIMENTVPNTDSIQSMMAAFVSSTYF